MRRFRFFGTLLAILTTAATAWSAGPEAPSDILAHLGFAVTGGAAPGYVEDRACAAGGCHAELCRSFAAMPKAHSFQRPRADRFVADFTDNHYYHAPSKRHYEMVRDGDTLLFRRYQLDENGEKINLFEQKVDWLHGAATLVRTYVFQDPDGELYQLPIAWYVETHSWGMAPGFDEAHHLGVQRRVRRECQFCHNAIGDVPAGADAYGEPALFPANLPEGIGCQRCHGPGAEHTRLGLLAAAGDTAVTSEALRDSIVNPDRLPASRNDDVCNQCHARPSLMVPGLVRFGRGLLSFRPGEPLSDYLVQVEVSTEARPPTGRLGAISQPSRIAESRCAQASGGALTCPTCHDSHHLIAAADKAAHYRRVCMTCHRDGECGVARAATPPAITADPDDCIACHMPKRPSNVNHFPITDHLIRKRPEVGPVAPYEHVVPVITDARAPGLSGSLGELYRSAAVVEATGNRDAVHHLAKLIAASPPEQLEPYLILARGQLVTMEWDELEATLRTVLRRAPSQRLALEWLGLARSARGDMDGAVKLLREALKIMPERVETHYNLGRLLVAAKRPAEAEVELRRAVAQRPNMAIAWLYLGRTLVALDRPQEAVAAYRRSLAVEPDEGRAYLELGRLLLSQGRRDEARRYWRHGVRVARHPEAVAAALKATFGEEVAGR